MGSMDRVLFERLGEPAVAVRFEGGQSVVTAANTAFQEVFGVNEAAIVGESLNDHIVAADDERSAREMDRAAATGETVEREVRRQTPDGPRWFLFRSVPFTVDGEQRGYGIYVDITERKQQQQRFEELIRHSNDIVSILDPTGQYRYQSPSAERVLGYDPETHVGQSAFDYVHPEDREEVMSEFVAAVDRPDAVPKVQYRFRHANGSWRWLESVGNNQLDNPAVEGFVVNSRDITARVEFEHELDLLRQVFSRIFRHNVRNRLNVIEGYTELVADRCGASVEALTERIFEATGQLLDHSTKAQLIADVVDDRSTRAVDLSTCVADAVAPIATSHPHATVEADVDSFSVAVHPAFVEAVRELVRNSLEHTPADRDPELRLWSDRTDDGVTLVLADNAGGLDETELSVLEEGRETSLEHSSGVGLWLVTWIVDRSGGSLSIEETDRGSRFRLQLHPAGDEPGPDTPVAPSSR
jgi:PAS domain S-box-containing protein